MSETSMTVREYLARRDAVIVPDVEHLLDRTLYSLTLRQVRLLRSTYPGDHVLEATLRNEGLAALGGQRSPGDLPPEDEDLYR